MAVKILGTGMTPFGLSPKQGLRSLAHEAIRSALSDAGLTAADVQMVVFANAVEGVLRGQEMIRGEVVLRHAGLKGIPILNVENACASSSSAMHVACMAVLSGVADVVLVVGAEQLAHPTKARSFAAVATAVDLFEEAALARTVRSTLLESEPHVTSVKASPLMDFYAAKTARYMAQWNVTAADVAGVSVKNRWHGSLNPLAQFQKTVTVEEVMASRMIVDPLRLLMCAPITNGAAAIVVASADFARRRGSGPSLSVLASRMTSNGADPNAKRPVRRAAEAAYADAGLGPEDIDVAEVHDACSTAELWLYEELRFCADGNSAQLLADGVTRLGGSLPVNTSGGLLSRGHPLGATGCAQIVELADQLRGRAAGRQVPNARIALAQNSGGILDDGDEAVAVVTILARDSK